MTKEQIMDGMYVNENFLDFCEIDYQEHYTNILLDYPHNFKVDLTCYNIMPGLSMVHNYSFIENRFSTTHDLFTYDNPNKFLLFTYIVDGIGQLRVGDDKYIFFKKGEISMYIKENFEKYYEFYENAEAVNIIINRDVFLKYLLPYNKEYKSIIDEFFSIFESETNIIFKAQDVIHELLIQMAKFKSNKELSKNIYFQIKIIEILIVLYETEFHDEKIEHHTYTDAQIRVVRKIKNHLSRDIASYISLDVLATSYGINLTTLKNCFKDMYGKPLYTWYREYKFERAKELIKNTNYPISKVANMVGYKSSSKFAKAFKKEIGVLPSTYRKN